MRVKRAEPAELLGCFEALSVAAQSQRPLSAV